MDDAKNTADAGTDTAVAEVAAATTKPAPKKKRSSTKRVSQPTATETQSLRQDGLQIDGFGLPVNGVARAKILGELQAEDPVTTKFAWNETLATKARILTEKQYG